MTRATATTNDSTAICVPGPPKYPKEWPLYPNKEYMGHYFGLFGGPGGHRISVGVHYSLVKTMTHWPLGLPALARIASRGAERAQTVAVATAWLLGVWGRVSLVHPRMVKTSRKAC